MLTERFVAHFHACVADLARRSAALTARPTRRAGAGGSRSDGVGPGIVPGATPRGSSRAGGAAGSLSAASEHKQSAPASAGGEQSRSRRVVKDTSAVEDGYSSSHSSRQGGGKEFGLPSTEAQEDAVVDEGEGEVYDSDASGASKLLGVMGLRSFSEDNWGAEIDPDACVADGDDVFRDVESGEENGINSPSSPPSATSRRHPPRALKKGGHSSSQRQPQSRQERLAQFCATPMRDPVNQPSAASGGGQRRTLGPAAITKAWAAVGRIDGGSGQLLGQVWSNF